jgi:hypothetical protein
VSEEAYAGTLALREASIAKSDSYLDGKDVEVNVEPPAGFIS